MPLQGEFVGPGFGSEVEKEVMESLKGVYSIVFSPGTSDEHKIWVKNELERILELDAILQR